MVGCLIVVEAVAVLEVNRSLWCRGLVVGELVTRKVMSEDRGLYAR